jgi:hypothetical protein
MICKKDAFEMGSSLAITLHLCCQNADQRTAVIAARAGLLGMIDAQPNGFAVGQELKRGWDEKLDELEPLATMKRGVA